MRILKDIFKEKKVYDANGNYFELKDHTSQEQCEFLKNIVIKNKTTLSLEVGLGYGISTLAILDGLSCVSNNFKHIVLDPLQNEWNYIGLENIKRSGFEENVEFYNDFSDNVLPKLFFNGTKIQFAYIDSSKIFDVLMVDTYYILKMMEIGGVLVFDDVDFPGIRKLLRYLVQLPGFKIFATLKKEKPSLKKKIAESMYKKIISSFPFKEQVIPNIDYKTDADLNVNYYCIALQKVDEDKRHWDWFVKF